MTDFIKVFTQHALPAQFASPTLYQPIFNDFSVLSGKDLAEQASQVDQVDVTESDESEEPTENTSESKIGLVPVVDIAHQIVISSFFKDNAIANSGPSSSVTLNTGLSAEFSGTLVSSFSFGELDPIRSLINEQQSLLNDVTNIIGDTFWEFDPVNTNSLNLNDLLDELDDMASQTTQAVSGSALAALHGELLALPQFQQNTSQIEEDSASLVSVGNNNAASLPLVSHAVPQAIQGQVDNVQAEIQQIFNQGSVADYFSQLNHQKALQALDAIINEPLELGLVTQSPSTPVDETNLHIIESLQNTMDATMVQHQGVLDAAALFGEATTPEEVAIAMHIAKYAAKQIPIDSADQSAPGDNVALELQEIAIEHADAEVTAQLNTLQEQMQALEPQTLGLDMDNLMNEIDADLAQFDHPSDPNPFVAIEDITAGLSTQSAPIDLDSSINNDHLFEGFFDGIDNENTPSTNPITLEADDIFAQIIPNDHDSKGSTIYASNVITNPLQNDANTPDIDELLTQLDTFAEPVNIAAEPTTTADTTPTEQIGMTAQDALSDLFAQVEAQAFDI